MEKRENEIEDNSNPALQNTSINLPILYIEFFDKMMDLGIFPSRTEGIRTCILTAMPIILNELNRMTKIVDDKIKIEIPKGHVLIDGKLHKVRRQNHDK